MASFSAAGWSQSTGAASAQGTCNASNTGANGKVTVTCYGVNKKLADQIATLVAKSSQDAKALKDISAKLAVLISEINDHPSITTVTSINQQGGITAGEVNISGTNAVQVGFEQIAINEPTSSSAYESRWRITLSGTVPKFFVSASSPIIAGLELQSDSGVQFGVSIGKLPNGDPFESTSNAIGRYTLILHSSSPTQFHIAYGCDGVPCVGPSQN
jgi:hypothetical protein